MINPAQKQIEPGQPLAFQGFPLGLNTAAPAQMISSAEMSHCVDFKVNKGGQLESRPAVTLYSDTPISGSVVGGINATLTATRYDIVAGSDYKIYWMDSLTPTLIGTAEGDVTLIAYNAVCVIMDGSYLKYIDDTTGIKIAYDAGDDGTQFDNIAGSQDSELPLNGTILRAGVKFTSDAWTAGYTIPLTEVHAALKKIGSPTGDITFRLRKVSDDSILAEKVANQTADQIATAGEIVEVVFSSPDVITEMDPATDYYSTVEFVGTGTDYISVMATDETGTAVTYSAGSYTVDITKRPVMKVYPGKPPKAKFGAVSGTRLFLVDPDFPGRVQFGNKSHLDWSTHDFAGWIGVIDDNRNSFEIGGLADLYAKLFVFGTEEQPYLCRLEGAAPVDYSLPLMFSRAWTTQKCLVNSSNDLWFGGSDGIDNLQGVQSYGDVRSSSESDPVDDRLTQWDENSFAGYYPKDGTYLLYMDGRVLCSNTKARVQDPNGFFRHPWFEYEMPVTPTCFGQLSSGFIIGADDGSIYIFNTSDYKDLSTIQFEPEFKTSYVKAPMEEGVLEKFEITGSSVSGADLIVSIYKDRGLDSSEFDYEFKIPWEDDITLDEALMTLDDATFTLSGTADKTWEEINMTVNSVMVGVKAEKLLGLPLFLNGLFLEYRGI